MRRARRSGRGRDDGAANDVPVRTLVQMDQPDHPVYRRISSDWFKPRSIARLNERAAELAKRYVDRMAELGGECDFVADVAVHYPLYVILSLLGLPEQDFPRMLKLTQELFGTVDPELGRGTGQDDLLATLLEFFEYFQKLTEDRRANPTDDLASVIANAEIDGQPIGVLEAVGYYVLIATAGHDTTSSAIAGGLHALIEHPDQLQRLRDDRSLVPTAVEEMVRWVSPVKQFMRTATTDYVLRGVSDPGGGCDTALVPVGQPRRGHLRPARRLRRRHARRTPTSASASERTSASVRTSPVWRCARSTTS